MGYIPAREQPDVTQAHKNRVEKSIKFGQVRRKDETKIYLKT